MQAWIFTGGWLLLAAAQLAVVIAAFRTTSRLGIMCLLVPFYGVSLGNARLATEYRRYLAAAWWAGLATMILSVVVR
jgi:hypothetical protein